MSRRIRKARLVAVAFVMALLILVWVVPRGQMEVRLIFLGYTNPLVQVSWNGDGERVTMIGIPEAVFLATNSGSLPVQLWPSVRQENFGNTTNFAWPSGSSARLPAVLKPRQVIPVTVRRVEASPWRTEFSYERHTFVDRICGKLWSSGNQTVQAALSRYVYDKQDSGWAQSGWITNTGSPAFPLRGMTLPGTIPPAPIPKDLLNALP